MYGHGIESWFAGVEGFSAWLSSSSFLFQIMQTEQSVFSLFFISNVFLHVPIWTHNLGYICVLHQQAFSRQCSIICAFHGKLHNAHSTNNLFSSSTAKGKIGKSVPIDEHKILLIWHKLNVFHCSVLPMIIQCFIKPCTVNGSIVKTLTCLFKLACVWPAGV